MYTLLLRFAYITVRVVEKPVENWYICVKNFILMSIPSDSQFVKSHGGENHRMDTYNTKLL
jgi:hypothetical protein